MSKSTAASEIPAMALKAGFKLKHQHHARRIPKVLKQRHLLAFYHAERNEGFQLICDADGFDSATWHAPTEYVTVVDKRKPGEFGVRDGLSLVADAKRRAVGMSEVRAEMRTSTDGLEIGYLDLKRRIKNKDWRKS